MMVNGPLSILILADGRRSNANTIDDHVDAFRKFSRNAIYYYDPISRTKSKNLNLDEFDVVVIHYSVLVLSDHYLHPFFRDLLAKYKGLKVQFIQDDYRQVNWMCARIREMGIRVLFTLYSPEKIESVYSRERLPGVERFSTLAGYVPDSLLHSVTPPLVARPLDFGYRGREVPFWLGDLGRDKVRIVQLFHKNAIHHAFTHDVSSREEDRIYGQDWPKFIASCKAMLGTESGSSITDFDGSAQLQVLQYLQKKPAATYDEVHAAVLRPFEGNVIHNCISPRAFETAALRTAMVLFPGEYSGILQPWVHYIPLAKDYSNFSEVVDAINNQNLMERMVERAHTDLIASDQYSYCRFVREFDDIIDRCATRHGVASKSGYEKAMQEPPPKVPTPWRIRIKHVAERLGVPRWLLRKARVIADLALRTPQDPT